MLAKLSPEIAAGDARWGRIAVWPGRGLGKPSALHLRLLGSFSNAPGHDNKPGDLPENPLPKRLQHE